MFVSLLNITLERVFVKSGVFPGSVAIRRASRPVKPLKADGGSSTSPESQKWCSGTITS
jgi:hypothetical protein